MEPVETIELHQVSQYALMSKLFQFFQLHLALQLILALKYAAVPEPNVALKYMDLMQCRRHAMEIKEYKPTLL